MADKTVIVTGASQGIGAGLANRFLERGYNVVATSRRVSQSAEISASERLACVDGDIAEPETAEAVVEIALAGFGSIDALVNNAGIFFTKPFIDYTIEDYRRLAATNLEGFLHLTQRVVRQMLAQKRGGSIVSITTPMVDHPIAGVNASVAMLTKGRHRSHVEEHCHGIWEGADPRQHGCARRCRHAAAQGPPEG